VTITGVNLVSTGNDFSLDASACLNRTLRPGATCSLKVTFSPTAPGLRTAILVISDTASPPQLRLDLVGTGTASTPTLAVTPANLTFGSQALHSPGPAKTVTLRAGGNAPVTITAVNLVSTGNDFSLDAAACINQTLQPGASCSLRVTFSPTAPGLRTAILVISDTASPSQQRLDLVGTGAASARTLAISPSSLSFGAQPLHSTSPARTVTLRASGDAPVNITAVDLVSTGNDFTLDASACTNQTLQPSASCTLKVTFSPTAPGLRTAILVISDTASQSQQRLDLVGTGK
jgi:hypothetical protein